MVRASRFVVVLKVESLNIEKKTHMVSNVSNDVWFGGKKRSSPNHHVALINL